MLPGLKELLVEKRLDATKDNPVQTERQHGKKKEALRHYYYYYSIFSLTGRISNYQHMEEQSLIIFF